VSVDVFLSHLVGILPVVFSTICAWSPIGIPRMIIGPSVITGCSGCPHVTQTMVSNHRDFTF